MTRRRARRRTGGVMLLIGALGSTACASHEPPAAAEQEPRASTMNLGLMYWAPSSHVLDGGALVFSAEVIEHAEHPARRPELRGPTVAEATLRVHEVLHQLDPPDAERPPPRLRPGDRVQTDGAEGLGVGDRVLVLATTYDGSYGIVPTQGTGTPLGIVLEGWSDPIVPAMRRLLADEVDWSSEAEVAIWRRFGEEAIECRRQGVPVRHCAAASEAEEGE